jgi:D-alanyl-lipoteichoic acid acyltransferase DltB (MBOAT superfamily)
MIFNSLNFVVFFVVFFAIYWFALKERTKLQNLFLLVGSYVFYAWADWKILPLLFVSTLVFYGLGIAISEAKTDKQKSLFAVLGVVAGLATLIYFKYTNFFITSFKELFEILGLQTNLHTFNIIVPVGISFYTFRLLSYVIDINRGKYEPTRDFVTFAAYVAFFPCILSGPIDRPNTLIPQLQNKRIFDYSLAVDGCRQILWGLFAKVVVADNCATYVNQIWENYQTQIGSTLLLAAVFYVFQMYADFSGYSNMAIGVGRLLGFRVTQNFNFPLFAQNIADFWRRWHISLTSWLTDYVFMPLNIKWRNAGNWGMIAAIVVNFVICGLWHGDKWTFVIWGFYHGLLFIPLILSGAMFKKNKIETYSWGFPKMKVFGRMLLTFGLVTLGLILFRAETIGEAVEYLCGIANSSLFSLPKSSNVNIGNKFVLAILLMIFIEWLQRNQQHGLEKFILKRNKWLRYAFYFIIAIVTALYSLIGEPSEFIYFKF